MEHSKRYGGVRCDSNEEINYGHVYSSTNRRIHPQGNAQLDVVYGEGNFISRIDEADRRRRGKKSYVLPLSDTEKESRAYLEF